MARPKKLVNATSKNWTKEELEAKKKEEAKLYNYDRLDFKKYPKALLKKARPEWKRIALYIRDLPISELDGQTVVRYCNYSYLYAEVVKKLGEEGPLTEEGKENPLVKVMNSYSKELKAAASDLGLTVNSRLKIISPKELPPEEADPFEEMLNEVDNDD